MPGGSEPRSSEPPHPTRETRFTMRATMRRHPGAAIGWWPKPSTGAEAAEKPGEHTYQDPRPDRHRSLLFVVLVGLARTLCLGGASPTARAHRRTTSGARSMPEGEMACEKPTRASQGSPSGWIVVKRTKKPEEHGNQYPRPDGSHRIPPHSPVLSLSTTGDWGSGLRPWACV